jgi:hypothetical protein
MANEYEQDEIPKIAKAEKEFIKQFWYKNIEDKREVSTEIVYL